MLNINTILHTKDGAKIGNAIITNQNEHYWEVTTDYGNKTKLTTKEINQLFNIAWHNYSKHTHGHDCNQMQHMMAAKHKHSVKI